MPHPYVPGVAMLEADASVVRAELDAILADSLFTHSKRCQAFLRYVVERTLDGHADDLKERTVGVEALGRPASYDTSLDPVVRTTAAEVRKRLAQYYQQHPSATIRLALPTGSYVPVIENHPAAGATAATAAGGSSVGTSRLRYYLLGAIAVVAIAATGTYLLRASPERSPVEDFWRPISSASGTVDVYLGPATGVGGELITLQAATALSRVVAELHRHGTPFGIKLESQSDFADIRGHSIVTIGLFNNQWTRHINETLRFQLVRGPDGPTGIRDTAHADRWWTRTPPPPEPQHDIVEDVALVTRVIDARTGHWVISIGGVGPPGTAAAAEFVTSPDHLARLVETAPSDWRDLNMQVLLRTSVHAGLAGPPQIVASHFWK